MQQLTWRMACTDKVGGAHRKLYRLPEGAKLVSGVVWWVTVNGDHVRCTEDGCNRAMRGVAIRDSHKGIGDRKDCGDRCITAIGPSCDCKCYGENHGAN